MITVLHQRSLLHQLPELLGNAAQTEHSHGFSYTGSLK